MQSIEFLLLFAGLAIDVLMMCVVIRGIFWDTPSGVPLLPLIPYFSAATIRAFRSGVESGMTFAWFLVCLHLAVHFVIPWMIGLTFYGFKSLIPGVLPKFPTGQKAVFPDEKRKPAEKS